MQEYWYLREGDFRPERVDVICQKRQESREEVLDYLYQHGNLFRSAGTAEMASSFIRSYLLSRPWNKVIKEFHVVFDTTPPEVTYGPIEEYP